jgi:hypothetical protein
LLNQAENYFKVVFNAKNFYRQQQLQFQVHKTTLASVFGWSNDVVNRLHRIVFVTV